MAANDALCVASALTSLASSLQAAVNTALDDMQADGAVPGDLQDIVKTYVGTDDDVQDPQLELPCLIITQDGATEPRPWQTKALDVFFSVSANIVCQQRDTVEDAVLDAHWYGRALQLALERTATSVTGIYDAQFASSRVESYSSKRESSRNRRVVNCVYDLRLRTTRGN